MKINGVAVRWFGLAMLSTGVLLGSLAVPAVWAADMPIPQEAAAHAPDLVGNWQGTLAAGKGLRTILRVSKARMMVFLCRYGPSRVDFRCRSAMPL